MDNNEGGWGDLGKCVWKLDKYGEDGEVWGGWEVVKFLEDIILVIVFFEHLCFVVLGVTGTEG